MNNFSFDSTAGTSHSEAKPLFPGNDIYDVVFDGCEIRDIKGVKDPDITYNTLSIKFSNEDGYFTHTVFEPKDGDNKRETMDWTDPKSGKVNNIPQASNIEKMMLLFKHLIDTVNPELAKEIDAKTKRIGAPDWKGLREVVIKATDPGKNKSTKIKLITNNKGAATFPFYASVNREGVAYINNNFIGDKLFFSTKEMNKIKNINTSKPTPISNFDLPDVVNSSTSNSSSNSDLDFDLI